MRNLLLSAATFLLAGATVAAPAQADHARQVREQGHDGFEGDGEGGEQQDSAGLEEWEVTASVQRRRMKKPRRPGRPAGLKTRQ